jgi:hypothetical protein
MEPYIGDAGVIILLILALLYFNWNQLFHE